MGEVLLSVNVSVAPSNITLIVFLKGTVHPNYILFLFLMYPSLQVYGAFLLEILEVETSVLSVSSYAKTFLMYHHAEGNVQQHAL